MTTQFLSAATPTVSIASGATPRPASGWVAPDFLTLLAASAGETLQRWAWRRAERLAARVSTTRERQLRAFLLDPQSDASRRAHEARALEARRML